MKINTKTNLPIATIGVLPLENNLVGEYNKINELMYKTNRSNLGQISWESPTSGILYRTVSSVNSPNIYNKGETGLYNLLLNTYGGDNGFIITADDYNKIKESIEENQSNDIGEITLIANEHNKAIANVNNKVDAINNQNIEINNYLVKINELSSIVCTTQVGTLLTADFVPSVSFQVPSDADMNNIFVSSFELLYPDDEYWTSNLGTLGYRGNVKVDKRTIDCFIYYERTIYNTAKPPQGTQARITYWYRRIGGANGVT